MLNRLDTAKENISELKTNLWKLPKHYIEKHWKIEIETQKIEEKVLKMSYQILRMKEKKQDK